MMTTARQLCLPIVLATLAGGTASAATYTTQAAFLAAHPTSALTSFAGMTTSISAGQLFARIGSADVGARDPYWVSTAFWGTYDSFLDNSFNGYLTVGVPHADAVGFYYASGYDDAESLDLTLLDGRDAVYHATLYGGGVRTRFAYFGIDGIGPVTAIELDAAGHDNAFASIAEISRSAVPEPASWGLLVTGFAATGAAARRARRGATAG